MQWVSAGTLRLQLLQNVFPGHVEAVRCAAHSSTMCLLLYLLAQQMSLVAFHITHQHARPAGLHNGRLQPCHLVFEKEARRVAPPIVIGQDHGDVFGPLFYHTGRTVDAQRYATR